MRISRLLVALLAASLLAGCGSGSAEDEAQSASGGSKRLSTVADVVSALEDNSIVCSGLDTSGVTAKNAIETGRCDFAGDQMVISVFPDQATARTSGNELLGALGEVGIKGGLVLGDPWLINAGERFRAEQISKAIGGEVIAP